MLPDPESVSVLTWIEFPWEVQERCRHQVSMWLSNTYSLKLVTSLSEVFPGRERMNDNTHGVNREKRAKSQLGEHRGA